MTNSIKQTAAQVAPAMKAAALKADSATTALNTSLVEANEAHLTAAGLADETDHHQHDRQRVLGARAPPVRLISKAEVLAITGMTFPTIWAWMRAGKFPRSRIVGGKSMWLSTEVEKWLAGLPVRPLKGDAEVGA